MQHSRMPQSQLLTLHLHDPEGECLVKVCVLGAHLFRLRPALSASLYPRTFSKAGKDALSSHKAMDHEIAQLLTLPLRGRWGGGQAF